MKKEMVKLQSEITTLIRMSELAKAQFQFSVSSLAASPPHLDCNDGRSANPERRES